MYCLCVAGFGGGDECIVCVLQGMSADLDECMFVCYSLVVMSVLFVCYRVWW